MPLGKEPAEVSSPAAVLAWMATEAGAALLAETALLPPDRLTRLQRVRRRYPMEIAAAAVELLELRRRARRKFARADAMFFTAEGLEQSTGERIARYRAGRFPAGMAVLDACCGIGGDALALAERGPVLGVDRGEAALVCARANASGLTQIARSLSLLCADVTRLDLGRMRGQIGAAFFDPSRRMEGRTGERHRVRQAEDYTPPLTWLVHLQNYFPACAVKVSPAVEDSALQREGARIEFLSDRGECKEAVLWFGSLAEILDDGSAGQERRRGYWATVLRPDQAPATLAPFPAAPPPLSEPRGWLYEPDPAVIRAHLLPQIAALLQARQLDPTIAYLTAEEVLPTPFATAYRILDWFPFHAKPLQAWLRSRQRWVSAVKLRGVEMEPDAIRNRLNSASNREAPPVVLVLARVGVKTIAILCDPPETSSLSS